MLLNLLLLLLLGWVFESLLGALFQDHVLTEGVDILAQALATLSEVVFPIEVHLSLAVQ